MKQQKSEPLWLVLADAKHARLLRCTLSAGGEPHLEQLEALENDWPDHEHTRPRPPGAKAGHDAAAPHHDTEEELRRFSHQVGAWLREQERRHAIASGVVIVPPDMLGELRDLKLPLWTLRQGEMTAFPPATLANHPVVRELMAARDATLKH